MVRAILEGRKTQARQVMSIKKHRHFTEFQPSTTPGYDWCFRDAEMRWHDYEHDRLLGILPIQTGDMLWVREAWRMPKAFDIKPAELASLCIDARWKRAWIPIQYEANRTRVNWYYWNYAPGCHRSALHMPRWASRLTLRVTDVRVQRLQEISEDDAISEGCEAQLECCGNPNVHVTKTEHGWPTDGYEECCGAPDLVSTAVDAFSGLWDSLNAKRGYGWDANPWVIACTFEPIHQNIDEEYE
jgi:hypothetical protein